MLFALAQAAPGTVLAQTTQTQLDEARERLKDLRGDYRVARDRVAQIRAAITGLTNQISQVTTHLEALGQAKQKAERGIVSAREKAEDLQVALDARARDVYIRGPAGVAELLLDAESLDDLADRFTFLDALSQKDASVAEGLDAQRMQLAQLRASLAQYEAEYERQWASLQGKQEELEAQWRAEERAKEALQEKVEEAQDIVADLEKQVQEELFAQYGITGSVNVGPPPEADGPFYFCPVDPPRSYIDDFGFPRVGHTHQGNDIFAPLGTPVRAPFAGRAEEGVGGLGGIYVHVYASGNSDYVYNAHLVEHAGVDGQQVQPGDIIGFVGTSGNAAGTPPHNHFEYHPGGGSAVSPYVYLNEVCGVDGAGF
jgi:murein DD-endopeptidase MepM/ murein hydrolase activator NlpD